MGKKLMGRSKQEGHTLYRDEGRCAEDEMGKELEELAGGDALFWTAPDCPADLRKIHLEDIRAFESIGSGLSLFEGLQRNGIELPPPEKLDELQSERKVMEVLSVLADLRIFLIGFDGMSGREFYSTLWHRTLWEGCYVRKRIPGAITLIDISHRLLQSEMLQFLEDIRKSALIQ
jgi:hypothetical protein